MAISRVLSPCLSNRSCSSAGRKKYCEDYVEGSELDHLAFWCKDVRADYKKTLEGGATSAVEPWDESGYTLAFVRDPDGVWIELIGKKVKPDPPKQAR